MSAILHSNLSVPLLEHSLRRGQRLEPIVIEMFQDEKGVFIQDRNTRYSHPEFPFLSAQIDFEYVIDPNDAKPIWQPFDPDNIGNGETKTVDPRAAQEWGPDESQEIPPYYAAQVMFGLAVTGRKQATVAALIGDDLRCYVFERDDELCDELIRQAVNWWDVHITMGIAPAIQTKSDASTLIKRFSGLTFEASDELRFRIDRLRGIKRVLAESKKSVEDEELEIQRLIVASAQANGVDGNPDKFTVLSEGKPIATWTRQKRSGYTVEPTEFMVLRLTGQKGQPSE